MYFERNVETSQILDRFLIRAKPAKYLKSYAFKVFAKANAKNGRRKIEKRKQTHEPHKNPQCPLRKLCFLCVEKDIAIP